MRVTTTAIPGVRRLQPAAHRDERGFLLELWNEARYVEQGVPARFVQDNLSFSGHGVLRGLHLQHPHGQAKLVAALRGEIFDVVVDLRRGSPTFGRWQGEVLSEENRFQLFVPAGLAHGFVVTGPSALVLYKCGERYHPESEIFLAWDDPELAIDWPIARPVLSPRDAGAPALAAIDRDHLPGYPPHEEDLPPR